MTAVCSYSAFDLISFFFQGNAYEALPIYEEMLQALCVPIRTGTHYGAERAQSEYGSLLLCRDQPP